MLAIREPTPLFARFVSLLGEEVTLKGFSGYCGGLDIKGRPNSATRSVYFESDRHQLMWHVVTLLPFSATDSQQVERKRHIGNDPVVVVFQDPGQVGPLPHACADDDLTGSPHSVSGCGEAASDIAVPFSPLAFSDSDFHSHFVQAYIVVTAPQIPPGSAPARSPLPSPSPSLLGAAPLSKARSMYSVSVLHRRGFAMPDVPRPANSVEADGSCLLFADAADAAHYVRDAAIALHVSSWRVGDLLPKLEAMRQSLITQVASAK
jgi:hypothetical protein